MQEIFDIAVAAGDRRWHGRENAPAKRIDTSADAAKRGFALCRVAHDATLVRRALELWLHERDEVGARRGKRQDGGQDQRQRNKARIHDDESRLRGQMRGGEVAGVKPLQQCHTRVARDLRMRLSVADIDGRDLIRAARKQDVGEAAGGRPDVEANLAGGIDAERVQRGRQLHAAARHPWIRGLRLDLRIRQDPLRSLDDGFAIDQNQTRRDRFRSLGPAGEKAACDKLEIGASRAQARRASASCSWRWSSRPSTFSTIPAASSPAFSYIFSGLSWSM